MFLQVSVCPEEGGACVARGHAWQGREGHAWQGGMCGRGCAWQGGMHGKGGVHGRGHAWQGGMCGRGACVAWRCVWQGGVCGRGTCMAGACVVGGMWHAYPPSRYYGYGIRSMSGRYASYWYAFLLTLTVCCVLYVEYLTNRFT